MAACVRNWSSKIDKTKMLILPTASGFMAVLLTRDIGNLYDVEILSNQATMSMSIF